MTDTELETYLGIAGTPECATIMTNMTAEKRAVYERLYEAECDIKLWQAGVGPKPAGVILCHDHHDKRHWTEHTDPQRMDGFGHPDD